MAAEIDLGDEDGFVSFTFGGASVRLDLFDANDKIRDALRGKEGAAQGAALVALMVSLGFPEPSRLVALRFSNAVVEGVRNAKKEVSGTAASLASTTSIPAP